MLCGEIPWIILFSRGCPQAPKVWGPWCRNPGENGNKCVITKFYVFVTFDPSGDKIWITFAKPSYLQPGTYACPPGIKPA
jgi:hypothetical protein